MAPPARIRINTQVPFPSQVTGSGVVAVSKQSGVWTVSLNFGAVAQVQSVPNPASTYGLVWDASTGTYYSLAILAAANTTSPPSTKTANYTAQQSDSSLIFNGSGSITLTLLPASSFPGQKLLVKTIANQTVISASSNVVPLAGGAAGTAILAATAGKWALCQSDGTNWIIMAGN